MATGLALLQTQKSAMSVRQAGGQHHDMIPGSKGWKSDASLLACAEQSGIKGVKRPFDPNIMTLD